jgi:hypothetical protein
MGRNSAYRRMLVVLAAGLGLAVTARAEGLLPAGSCPCPGGLYSGCHFWAPQAWRVKMCWQGQTMDKVPVGVPACFRVLPYPCPAADPADVYADSIYALLAPKKTTPAVPAADAPATSPAPQTAPKY